MSQAQPEIFETPDPIKSIDEINAEIEPKVVSSGAGIETRANDMTIQEIFQHFDKITQQQPKVSYIKSRLNNLQPKTLRLERYKRLLQNLIDEAHSSATYSHHQSSLQDIQVRISKIEDKIKKFETESYTQEKIQFKDISLPQLNPGNNNIVFQVNISESNTRYRLAKLEQKIKALEFKFGEWAHHRSINSVIKDMVFRARLLNPAYMEKLEDSAKSLGTDIDILYTSGKKADVQVQQETAEAVERIFNRLQPVIQKMNGVLRVLERLKSTNNIFAAQVRLNQRLVELEDTMEILLSTVYATTDSTENLVTSFEENLATLMHNLESLTSQSSY